MRAPLSHYQVRVAGAQDLSALADILTESFHPQQGWTSWFRPVLRLGIYEDLRHRFMAPPAHYVCLVACEESVGERGNLVAGTVELALRPQWWLSAGETPLNTGSSGGYHAQYPYISNLAVRAQNRRQGAAMALLNRCETVAIAWGFQDLYLHVLENNPQARNLYVKAGYRLKKIDPSWGSWLCGHPRRLFLHKPLASPPALV